MLELEAELASLRARSGQRRIALGMVVEKVVPGEVLAQWLQVLRSRHWPGPTIGLRAYNVLEGRNAVTARALERPAGDWEALYFTDADMLPDPGLADRLQELVRLPEFQDRRRGGVIVGSYYGRELPFEIQLWRQGADRSGLYFLEPKVWARVLAGAAELYARRTPAPLMEVGGGGTGSMLIRRDVLERMQDLKGRGKVWELPPLPDELREHLRAEGEDKPGARWTEDINFCLEVRRELGIQVLADTDLRLAHGHVRSDVVGPNHYLAAHVVPERVQLAPDSLPAGYGLVPAE